MSLEQQAAIRELLARSSDCVWRKDAENYSLCWATDGEWRVLGQSFKGRPAVKEGWSQFMGVLKRAWQATQHVVIELDGPDRAHGRLYLEETLYMPDGKVNSLRGIYYDRYKIEDGRWVFARRHIDMFYLGPFDMSGRFFDIPDYGVTPAGADPDRPASPSMEEAYG